MVENSHIDNFKNGTLRLQGADSNIAEHELSFDINKDTTPLEIKNKLSSIIKNHVHLDDSEIDLFRFSKIKILGRSFNVKIYFVSGKLSQIRLDSPNEDCASFEELFERDCKWIKTILGEASISGKNGVVYAFDKFQISVTYQPDDGRCGADEFINLHYERG